MNIKKFWDEALTYEQYLELAANRIEHPENENDKEFQDYYKLGLQRMARTDKIYQPSEDQKQVLANKKFDGKVLIITEPWCGDASNAVPVAHKLFSENEVRITLRDQTPSLIDNFLTNGSKSIPIVVFLDEDFNIINHWGPRPAYGVELQMKFKNNPETYTKEQFHNDLQVYYAKNRGIDTTNEMLELL